MTMTINRFMDRRMNPPAIDQPELFPRRRLYAAEIPGPMLATLDERLAEADARLLDFAPVSGARWRVRYYAPEQSHKSVYGRR